MNSRIRPILASFPFRLFITSSLIAVLAIRLDLEKLLHTITNFEPTVALGMFGINLVALVLFAKRWQLIASGLGLEARFWIFLRAIWLANFFSQFGPSLLLAEATRFQALRRLTSKRRLITSQVLDRVSGQIVLFLIVLALLPLYGLEIPDWWSASIGLGFMLIGLGMYFLPHLHRHLYDRSNPDIRQALRLMGWRHIQGHYGVSLALQLLLILNFNLAAFGIGVREPLAQLLIFTPLVFAALTLLPLTISDWGSREAAAAVLLSPSGIDSETLVAVSVVYGLLHLLAALPGGLFLLYRVQNETPNPG